MDKHWIIHWDWRTHVGVTVVALSIECIGAFDVHAVVANCCSAVSNAFMTLKSLGSRRVNLLGVKAT